MGARSGLGRATILGSIGKGGPGWIDQSDRTVRDSAGPACTVPTTLNAGLYYFAEDNLLRSLCLEETVLCQGLMTVDAAKVLNYRGAAVSLPLNFRDASTAVGNGESARQAQSVARSAKHFLNKCRDQPAGLLSTPAKAPVV
jgi:hypothetical protein